MTNRLSLDIMRKREREREREIERERERESKWKGWMGCKANRKSNEKKGSTQMK